MAASGPAGDTPVDASPSPASDPGVGSASGVSRPSDGVSVSSSASGVWGVSGVSGVSGSSARPSVTNV